MTFFSRISSHFCFFICLVITLLKTGPHSNIFQTFWVLLSCGKNYEFKSFQLCDLQFKKLSHLSSLCFLGCWYRGLRFAFSRCIWDGSVFRSVQIHMLWVQLHPFGYFSLLNPPAFLLIPTLSSDALIQQIHGFLPFCLVWQTHTLLSPTTKYRFSSINCSTVLNWLISNTFKNIIYNFTFYLFMYVCQCV